MLHGTTTFNVVARSPLLQVNDPPRAAAAKSNNKIQFNRRTI